MNQRVDVIVIGDSKAGNEAIKQLAKNLSIKIAFISREFKNSTSYNHINVEYIKEEVIFIDYKKRLFCCYLSNGDNFFSTHLIVATGLIYEPLIINNMKIPNVFNNVEDIPKYAKELPAVVLGKSNTDVTLALKVAKKFKQVYLCSETFKLKNVTSANIKKLAETDNILVLPNTSITKALIQDNQLKSVELTNYSNITCSAIFVKTPSKPEISFIPTILIDLNKEGYIKTTSKSESTKVPKCFAIGNCAEKSTKKMFLNMLETILLDFKEEY